MFRPPLFPSCVSSAFLFPVLLFVSAPLLAQSNVQAPSVRGPEDVVQALYDLVTFPESKTPDWDRARSLFLPEAVVVLRTSRTENTVFSVDGWIQDFVHFIETSRVESTGFSEKIVRTHATVFGDIAQIWVLYEAGVPGTDRPPQQGVDGFHLVRHGGRWLIASIVNELPILAGELPEVLRTEGEGGSP